MIGNLSMARVIIKALKYAKPHSAEQLILLNAALTSWIKAIYETPGGSHLWLFQDGTSLTLERTQLQ